MPTEENLELDRSSDVVVANPRTVLLPVGPSSSSSPMSDREGFTLQNAFLEIWAWRWFVAKAALVGLVVSGVLAFLIPPAYESTTRLMPPDNQSASTLALMASAAGDKLGGLALDALGLKSTSGLFIGMLQCRTVQDRLISRFNLRQVYGVSSSKDAMERLAGSTAISEDRKSGIITITTEAKSPQLAASLAQGYVEELDRLTAEVSTSAARRERMFIEQRLQAVKLDLDTASRDFSRFSSKNTAIDINAQGKAMVDAAAQLQGDLIVSEGELSSLRQIYTDSNIRVRGLKARIDELKRQLGNLRGTDASLEQKSAAPNDSSSYPSIRELPVLGVAYADYYRRLKIQESVFEILTKQYELAKIQEAKEIPTVKILDAANIPERKIRPLRTRMTFMGASMAGFLAIAYILILARWRTIESEHPVRVLGLAMWKGLTEDIVSARLRFSGSKNGVGSRSTKS
ncbi:MAG TPA: Wzz/FepE/Etk N-terminal domain-containing protein [Candidatus Acidoferrum sp.]